MPSLDPYVLPQYDQHILRNFIYTVCCADWPSFLGPAGFTVIVCSSSYYLSPCYCSYNFVYIYIVYTPFCMLGVYMHIGSIHGILYYQFPSSAGIPSCWFSSCLVLFYPPCLVVQWVLDSFDPSSLRTRNRLFLSVAGRLGSTLFLGVVSSS